MLGAPNSDFPWTRGLSYFVLAYPQAANDMLALFMRTARNTVSHCGAWNR